ncbi:MAG: lactate 2-monooxygenase [Bacteroidota bacterium]
MSQPSQSEHNFSAMERQREIYVSGMSGKMPLLPLHPDALEAKAREVMSSEAFAYVAGGAGHEDTVSNNRQDFHQWQIWPRMLRDVSQRDTSISLFGRRLPGPLLLSPVGVLDLAHKEADLAVAKACAAAGLPMIFSNQASVTMEDCAAVMGSSPRWFQLYWSKSNDLVASLVQRAEACGCEAIVVTLDTTMLGWRLRDLDLAYLPFLRGRGIAQYISDPVFQQQLLELGDAPPPKAGKTNFKTLRNVYQLMSGYPGSTISNLVSKQPLKAVRQFIDIYSRPSLTWADLPFLRQHTRLPILLKGILHPDDARQAVDAGVDGLIVSNHGGRQVDGAVSAIQALPGVIEAVGGQLPVLMDSGVRGGADMFKALALGAKAVCIGRPYVYALGIAGEAGVAELLRNLMADFELTMGLAGCKNIAEINRECLRSVS